MTSRERQHLFFHGQERPERSRLFDLRASMLHATCSRYIRPSILNSTIQLTFRTMKRKASPSEGSARKAPKTDDYCNVEQKRDSDGSLIWPAPETQMMAARKFLKDWYVPLWNRPSNLTSETAQLLSKKRSSSQTKMLMDSVLELLSGEL